ncbi:MAG: 4-hydroxy-tetrahydrodipicolinate reductase [Flavobacteriaceae bacterium]
MNVALLGYGRMGKLIEKIAVERQHRIVAIKDIDRPAIDYSQVELAIDFSSPEIAADNILECLENGIPVVSGTTGWLERLEEVTEVCSKKEGALLYASNFSLGVNIFFALNTYLAQLMNHRKEYKVDIEEIHHIHKVDAPSGTAITLAEDIISDSFYSEWKLNEGSGNTIPIHSKRAGEVPGTHSVRYTSPIDELEIRHTAHNRDGFALGAVIAAEWLRGKTGVFSMKDVLNLG